MIAISPVGEVGGVEVRGVDVDRCASGLPDINDPRLGSATWIIAGSGVFTGKPGVHVQRLELDMAGLVHAVYVAEGRIIPLVEETERRRAVGKPNLF